MSTLEIATFGLLAIIAAPALTVHADTSFPSSRSAANVFDLPLKGAPALRYTPYTMRDLASGGLATGTAVTLDDGRIVDAFSYLRELNIIEHELSGYGATLRGNDSDLGTVARAQTLPPKLSTSLPTAQQQSSTDSAWSHELRHQLAAIKSAGRIIQKSQTSENNWSFERTTTHSLEGRFLDASSPSIGHFIHRVVRNDLGEERGEIQVYINGRQVFRHGRADSQEARVWKTAFDVPLKNITIPVGPGSLDAKIGIRGGVNLDLDLSPVNGSKSAPQMALDFKPQILADGYLSAATTPTNVGEAGLEGAITLADNTLKIVGTAALSRTKFVDVKQLTVDNIFAGFNGRIYGFVDVKVPGRNAADPNKKHFEKEFYKWDGIKVENRLYEYKAPQPPTL